MLTAPKNWDALWARIQDEAVRMEVRAVIGGTVYGPEQIQSCKAYPAAFESLAIGQAASAQLSLSFLPLGTVPRGAKIELSVRLTDGAVSTPWVPQGTFYKDSKDQDKELGVMTVTAFDRMMYAEELYFSSGTISGVWPKAAPAVVSDICTRLGIALDSRSTIDSALMVPMPVNLTMRDVLREIAAAHGGNFIVTPENRLRLLVLEDLPDMTLLGDENGNFVGDEYGNRVLIIEGSFADMPCEEARSSGERVTVSGVVLTLDDEHAYTAGDETGYTLTATCLCADQNAANRALARVKNVRYDPAEVTGAVFNPLLELGDALYSGGNLFRAYSMEIDYDALFVADIRAPIEGEVEHEIPYQSSTERLVNWKTAQTRAYIDMGLEELELGVKNDMLDMSASINIQLDSITSRVQGAEGNISTLTQTADSITTEISYMDRDISRISQKVDNIRLEVSNGERSSWIDLTIDGVEVSSQQIRFSGDVVFENDLLNGTTTISGDCIRTGEITTDYIHLGGKMEVYQSPDSSFLGGYIGYMQGQSAEGDSTYGIGIMEDFGDGVVFCTSRGARMSFANRSSVTCTYSRVSLTGDEIVVNGTLKNADGTVITSDRNAKEDIREDADRYLPLFDRLNPVSFRLKGRNRRHLGFVAQDVEKALAACGIPSADFAGLVIDETGGYGLRYEEFIPLLAAKLRRLEEKIKEMSQ